MARWKTHSPAQLTTKPTWRTTPYNTGSYMNSGSSSSNFSGDKVQHNCNVVSYGGLNFKSQNLFKTESDLCNFSPPTCFLPPIHGRISSDTPPLMEHINSLTFETKINFFVFSSRTASWPWSDGSRRARAHWLTQLHPDALRQIIHN